MFPVEQTDKTFIKTCDGEIGIVLKRLVNLNCEKKKLVFRKKRWNIVIYVNWFMNVCYSLIIEKCNVEGHHDKHDLVRIEFLRKELRDLYVKKKS